MSAFWNFVTRMVPGTLAKAEDVNTNLDGINTGLNLVEVEIDKAIQITNSPGVTDIGLNASARANKLLAFDANGDIAASQILGDWQEDHVDAAGTDYEIRDVVKDAAGSIGQDNIYICKTTHTSTGSLATDIANWDLLVDVAGVAASAAAALVSENNAATSADFLDDRALGPFSTANEPTLDNDGNALLTGAQYFNTDLNRMKVYTGSVWQLNTAAAADVTIADAGAIYTAVEVEAALQEVKLLVDPLNTAIDSSADATAITIDSSENVGIGNTLLEAWATGWEVLQLGAKTSIGATANTSWYMRNAYYDGAWKYQETDEAQYFDMNSSGEFGFYVAPSGTADTAISWTTALTLDNSANATFGGNVSAAGTISEAGTLLSAKYAALASPALTGNPTAPTQTAGDNSTKIATTAFVNTANAGLNTKIIDIGDWNMDSSDSVNVAHGLTRGKIRTISVIIRDNSNTASYPINHTVGLNYAAGGFYANSVNIVLDRSIGLFFDDTIFNSTSYNRGWVTIQYTD